MLQELPLTWPILQYMNKRELAASRFGSRISFVKCRQTEGRPGTLDRLFVDTRLVRFALLKDSSFQLNFLVLFLVHSSYGRRCCFEVHHRNPSLLLI